MAAILRTKEWLGVVEFQSGGLPQCLKAKQDLIPQTKGVVAQKHAHAGRGHHQLFQGTADDFVGESGSDFGRRQKLRNCGEERLQAVGEVLRKDTEARLAHAGENGQALDNVV